jgi:hypothetical protein
MQKSSKNMPDPTPPPDLLEAAAEADAEVVDDLLEKLGPVMDSMGSAERKALESAALALASKIVGETIPDDQKLQAFAVALTSMNAFRQSLGETEIDPEVINPMMLTSMIEDLIRDEDFFEFIEGDVDVGEEMMDEEMKDEDTMEEEGSMVEPAKSLMNRRSTLMGAM